MGLRFRKSINLGCFRVNLSKHGIGYSIGVPGFRKTIKATGGTRTTCSIPGTGLSYSTDSKKLKLKSSKKSSSRSARASSTTTVDYVDPFKVESVMQESNQNEFVNNLNKATSFNRRRIPWLCVSAFMIFIGIYGMFSSTVETEIAENIIIGLLIAVPFIFVFRHYRKMRTIDLDVEMDTDVSTSYADVEQINNLLSSISIVTEMTSYDNTKKQVRTDVDKLKFGKEKILGLNSKCEFCYIQSNTVKVYFLPNIILTYQNKKWIGVDYSDLNITYQSASLFRTKKENTDSTLIREGWAYENKDGSRDKRYSPNFPGYYYNYGCIKMTSTNGLKLYMMTSNANKGLQFKETIFNYIDLLTKEEK
jgi:hypothetical protein